MKKNGLLLALLILGLGASTAKANPCNDDVDKWCGNNQPGMGDVGSCMEAHRNDLTYQCREWMKKMDNSLKQLQSACSWPARDYCRDIKPGYNRVVTCLKNNFDKLPPACQEALKNH